MTVVFHSDLFYDQLINSADPDAAVPADSTKPDSVSNDGANKSAEPAKIGQPTPVMLII